MKKLPLDNYLPNVSQLVMGCMGLGGSWDNKAYDKSHLQQAHALVDAALDAGINLFDHADIYTWGKAEQVFGQVLADRPDLRQDIYLQTKCGIRFKDGDIPGRYDFSYDWIMSSVEGSLKRLQTDYIDILELHRPDPLMQLEEVAHAFFDLHKAGKVGFFGVSNMSAQQIHFLQNELNEPLVTNQIEMGLHHTNWLDEGVDVNFASTDFSSGTVEYCRMQGVQLQAWASLSQGYFSGRSCQDQPEHIQKTAELVKRLASEYQVSREAIILAWLFKYPANVQAVIGTTDPQRIQACAEVAKVELSREHWYQLYVSARGRILP